MWDQQEGVCYNGCGCRGRCYPLRVRWIVGLIPLFAVETFDADTAANLEGFQRRTMVPGAPAGFDAAPAVGAGVGADPVAAMIALMNRSG
ncbi:MAG: hypothetical protein QM757_15020 [Paludibaculum sp.]